MRWLIAALFIAASAPAAAQEPLAKVYACADIADSAQRLACFDAAVSGLRKDVAGGDVTVLSREQLRQADEQQLGARPSTVSAAVAAAAGKTVEDKPDVRVKLPVRAITTGPDGKLRVLLENGQLWRQTDDQPVQRLGDGPWTAEIRPAVMGTFFMNIDGKRAIRVRRAD